MPRRLAFALAVLATLCAAPAATARPAKDVNLLRLLADEIREAKAHTPVPILLPDAMPSAFRRHYPEGRASAAGWTFRIGAVRGCGGASACFIAEFRGRDGGKPTNRRSLRLARGRTGWFRPLRCGASCSPPSIQWRERRSLFTIRAKVGTKDTERRLLVRMANSAIRRGPR
jgi:hypothetical protein